jgi:chaperonin GroES
MSTFPIQPLTDWVILKPITEAEYFESSVIQLVKPQTSYKRPTRGVVMAHGPGRINTVTGAHIPMPFKVGDIVHHTKYAGTEIKYDGEEYVMIKEIELMLLDEPVAQE